MSNTSYFGTSLHSEKKQYLNTVNTQRWHVQQTKQSPGHQTMVNVMTGEMSKILDTYKERRPARQPQQRICILPFFVILWDLGFIILDKNNFFHTIRGAIIHHLPITGERMFSPLGRQQHTLAADTRKQQALIIFAPDWLDQVTWISRGCVESEWARQLSVLYLIWGAAAVPQ